MKVWVVYKSLNIEGYSFPFGPIYGIFDAEEKAHNLLLRLNSQENYRVEEMETE